MLVVAKAYVDQLERSQAMSADQISSLRQEIQKAETKKKPGKLKDFAKSIDKGAATAKNAGDASRMRALAEVLRKPMF